VPALPSWLTEPLWDQFAALLPPRPTYDTAHPLGCHRRRIADRIVFDKLLQVLRFGCSYQGIADTTCSATTIRTRRDEWKRALPDLECKCSAVQQGPDAVVDEVAESQGVAA
jgi:transposase